MGFFDLFKKSDNKYRGLSDEDREKSVEIRNLNREMRALEKQKEVAEKKAELAEMKAEFREERGYVEEEHKKPEDVFFEKAITHLFTKKQPEQPQPDQQEDLIPLPEFSDAEIDGIIEQFIPKKYKLLAKVLSEENIKRIILNLDESGMLDEATAVKIAKKLKGVKE